MPTPYYEIPTSQNIYNLNSSVAKTVGSYVAIYSSNSQTGGSYNSWIFPLPNSLDYGAEYKWSAEELGHLAAKIMSGVQKGINAATVEASKEAYSVNKFARGIAGFVDTVFENTANADVGNTLAEEAKRQLLYGAGSLLGNGQTLSKEWLKNQGQAYNPNEQLYFDGVSLRDFSLSFTLTPLSAEESLTFANAIAQMRQSASPSFTANSFYFTYPDYFEVYVHLGGKLLLRRTKCALTNITVDLAPDGQITWHDDGRPISYTLSLQFKESIIPTKEVEANAALLGVTK